MDRADSPQPPDRDRDFTPEQAKAFLRQTRGFLGFTGQIYHRQPDAQPTAFPPIAFGRFLESSDEPYMRNSLWATEDWAKIDGGWVGDEVGALVIQNEEGLWLKFRPTLDEERAIAERVIEIGLKVGDDIVPIQYRCPGECFPDHPTTLADRYIRCRKGRARYSIFIVPR